MSAPHQRTICRVVSVEGSGLHSGRPARVELKPAAPETGIIFRRRDADPNLVIPATLDHVVETDRQTVLGRDGIEVQTVEHLLAAAVALELDNLEVVVDGPEPPILDGSAAVWCARLEEAGVEQQSLPALVLEPSEPLSLREGDSRYTVTPEIAYTVSVTIDFDHPLIGRQTAHAEVGGAFRNETAPARTFGLASWKEELHARGLALGAGTENTVVLTEAGLAADVELRFPDEFARHKIVDLVGDLALIGARLRGHVEAERPSHRGNISLARALREQLKTRST